MVTGLLLGLLIAGGKPEFVVCLDPGHPSENGRGAVGSKVTEVELVWDLSQRVKKLLGKQGGLRVVMTKSSLEETVTNKARAEIANHCKADLFLRIHADSGGVSGFATYFPSGQARVHGVLGPSQEVLERSTRLAPVFHRAAMALLKEELPDLGCRSEKHTFIGGKQRALTGSVFAKVPVVLIEVCAVDNEHDAEFVSRGKGREELAKAIAAGVEAVRKEIAPHSFK